MINKNNENMAELREIVLNDIYRGGEVSEAELNVTDLFIYSKNNTLFSRLNKVFNISELDENIILTDEQISCLNILDETNLFLSAPTSFGKTFIAFEYIFRNVNKLNNVIFVVPTISLMNEVRKKAFLYFNDKFVLITSDSELEQYRCEEKKIMIVVPERISTKKFKKYIVNNSIDLLVYDEIYKLNYSKNERDSNDRVIKMNYIYKYLIDKANKIILLGPFIKNVNFDKTNIHIEKYVTNLNLVHNEIIFDENQSIFTRENCCDKKFVYFKSPNSIKKFLNENDSNVMELACLDYDKDVIDWISDNIHEGWYYSIYLKHGIGIHHGKTPIFLRKYIENEYSKVDGYIHTILCTSTLMEGINTPTNKLIIHDAPRGPFEMNNLIGRVGRLNVQNPITGKVYVLSKYAMDLYDPKEWIELNILYETSEILTSSEEDEILYLDKASNDGKVEEGIEELRITLKERFDIDLYEVIDLGIEFKLLIDFINEFDKITSHSMEKIVISDIKYKLLRNENTYQNGLDVKTYSFEYEGEYIFDAVYQLLLTNGKMKPVIDKFESLYNPDISDINIFIDTLFQIDEFIKFKMMKVVAIYELFNSKQLFSKSLNRAFLQSMHMIESYYNTSDGYERVLGDMGIPKEDVDEISNAICRFSDVKGTEYKLKKIKKEEFFKDLSPFSKKIIESL